MRTIGQDVRFAIRRMKSTPGFTLAAIATLALGLGVNSAALSLAHAVFLKPLPVPEASRIVLVDATLPDPSDGGIYPLVCRLSATIATTHDRSQHSPPTTRPRRCT